MNEVALHRLRALRAHYQSSADALWAEITGWDEYSRVHLGGRFIQLQVQWQMQREFVRRLDKVLTLAGDVRHSDAEVGGMLGIGAGEVRRGIAEQGQGYVSEATGFDAGDVFETEEQVREYFTVDTIRGAFDGCPYTPEGLAVMAEAVIAHRWHMSPQNP